MSLRTALPFVAVVASAQILAGCGEGGLASFLISDEQELEIGQQVHAELIAETPVLANQEVTDYVAALGAQMVPLSPRNHLQHQFFVLDTEQVNAFAVPGGYIYVTVGLLRNTTSRSELAGVVGHEIGHIAGRHGAEAMQTSIIATMLSDYLLGDTGVLQQIVEWLTGTYLQGAHSQEKELEADRFGVEFAAGANYNPWGIVTFFEFIERLQGGSSDDFFSKWLLSHPQPDTRIEQAEGIIMGLGIARDEQGYVVDEADPPFRPIEEIKALLPPPPADGGNGGADATGSSDTTGGADATGSGDAT